MTTFSVPLSADSILHDPVRWKYHAIGNCHLDQQSLPRTAYL